MTWFDALFRFSVVENSVDGLSILSWKYLKDTLFIHFSVFFFLFRISIYVKKILYIYILYLCKMSLEGHKRQNIKRIPCEKGNW